MLVTKNEPERCPSGSAALWLSQTLMVMMMDVAVCSQAVQTVTTLCEGMYTKKVFKAP
jgi:hypothetical protein